MPRPDRVSREAIYERVWSKPMRDVAREFKLSDIRRGKISRQFDIPSTRLP